MANRFAPTERDVLVALAVVAYRGGGSTPRLDAADLLALAYVRGHLACGRPAPVAWLAVTIDTTRYRYKVAGPAALGLLRFALDYASTRFRPTDRLMSKLGAHFDWYLSVKETTCLEHPGHEAPGVTLDETSRSRLSADAARYRDLEARVLDAWRAEWEQAVKSLDRWRTYRL